MPDQSTSSAVTRSWRPAGLDLALFFDLAAAPGEKGVQEWLSFYFRRQ